MSLAKFPRFSVCLARGRSYTVPRTALIENCDLWHVSDIADPRDGPMTSMAVLRRDLVSHLYSIPHSLCASNFERFPRMAC